MLQELQTQNLSPQANCVVETERLTLRKPTLADLTNIVRLANDIRIAQTMRRMPHPYLADHAFALLDSNRNVFLVEKLQQPVGMVEVSRHDLDTADLTLWLGVDHAGMGYATEIARAAIDLTFEHEAIQQITASARVANPAARNVLEKCGFQWIGVELHRYEALGSSTPVDCFRLNRSVWASLKHWTPATKR